MAWYYQRGGVETGPLSPAELKEAARLGRIDGETPVRRDTDKRWFPASQVRGLEFDELIFPPPLPPSPDPTPEDPGEIRIQPVARTPKPSEKRLAAAGRAASVVWRGVLALRPDPAPGAGQEQPARLVLCPACDGQVSRQAEACPHCGHPTTPAKRGPGGKHSPAEQLTAVAILGGLVVCVLFCSGVFSGDASPTGDSARNDEYYATEMADKFVQEQLKAPSTAKFPWKADSVTKEGDGWRVRSHVDSQNGFGAMIRSKYVCVVRHNGGRSWECLYLEIDGEQCI